MDLKERHDALRRHPWESTRFDFFTNVLRELCPLVDVHSVLDVGSGDAWFANGLARRLPLDARVTCWDAGYEDALVEELGRNLDRRICLTGKRPVEAFDVVLMLDVIEHVPDDAAFLRQVVAENMAAGSTLLFSVPAWQTLWSSHDEHLHHFRRYSPVAAASLLRGANLRLRRSGGLFHSLLLPRLGQILFERLSPRSPRDNVLSAWSAGAPLTATIRTLLAVDNMASRVASRASIDLPGLSWWAICEKM